MRVPRELPTILLAIAIGVPLTVLAGAMSFGLVHSSGGWVIALFIAPGFLGSVLFLSNAPEWAFWAFALFLQVVYYFLVAKGLLALVRIVRKREGSNAS